MSFAICFVVWVRTCLLSKVFNIPASPQFILLKACQSFPSFYAHYNKKNLSGQIFVWLSHSITGHSQKFGGSSDNLFLTFTYKAV
jgi:hypothetical protein